MSKLSMYGYYFLNAISRGNLLRKGEIAADGIKSRFGSIYTRRYTKKVYCLTEFPVLDYGNPVARIIRSEMLISFPKVKIFIHPYVENKRINIKDLNFLRKFNREQEIYDDYKSAMDRMNKSDKITGKKIYGENGRSFTIRESDYLKHREIYRSYEYVIDNIKEDRYKFFNVCYFVELLIPDNIKISNVTDRLVSILDKLGINYFPLENKTARFLSNYSLTACKKESKLFPSMLFSSEDLAMNSSYMSPGVVASDGMLLGKDLLSNMPFMPNFYCTGGAKVVMILAESGFGKSYTAFDIASQFPAFKTHVSVLDIKGNEWTKPLQKMGLDVLTVHMDSKTGTYVNFLRLDDIVTPNMSKADIEEVLDMAVTGTEQLLATMVALQPNEGNEVDVYDILREAIIKLYTRGDNGFNKDDPSTYYKTRDFTYKNVLDIIAEFGQTAVKDANNVANYDVERARLCRLICKRCAPYVQATNSIGSLFKHEISVKDVLDKEAVVYSLGLNATNNPGIANTVRILMMQFLDTKKQYIRKKKGLYTAAFYEELQRCGDMKAVVKFISSMVTGGRSNNLIIFLLLNAISTFDDDQFKPIKSNITMVFAGRLKKEDIDRLVKEFDCSEIEDYLYDINPAADPSRNRSTLKSANLGNAFAARFKVGETTYDKAIFRTELPSQISEIFRTTSKVKR